MKVTPSAEEIVQGRLRVQPTGGVKVSAIAGLMSSDNRKPTSDAEQGALDGKADAVREFTEGKDYPSDYDAYDKARRVTRNRVGKILDLPVEKPLRMPVTGGK